MPINPVTSLVLCLTGQPNYNARKPVGITGVTMYNLSCRLCMYVTDGTKYKPNCKAKTTFEIIKDIK